MGWFRLACKEGLKTVIRNPTGLQDVIAKGKRNIYLYPHYFICRKMDLLEVCTNYAEDFNTNVGMLLQPVGIRVKAFTHHRTYGVRFVVQWERKGELLCQHLLRIKKDSQLHNTLLTEFLLFEKQRVKRMRDLLITPLEEDSQIEDPEEESQALQLYLDPLQK